MSVGSWLIIRGALSLSTGPFLIFKRSSNARSWTVSYGHGGNGALAFDRKCWKENPTRIKVNHRTDNTISKTSNWFNKTAAKQTNDQSADKTTWCEK